MKRILYIVIPLIAVMLLLLPVVHTGHPPSPGYITQVHLKAFDAALAAYWNDYGRTPTGRLSEVTASLSGLSTNDNRRQIRYIEYVPISKTWYGKIRGGNTDKNGNYLDGWHRPITLTITQAGWSLVSSGADGIKNSDDDVAVNRKLHEH